ncbi:MAG: pyridoxamine 5'-phosphate oxidase family protein [Actinomycetota bacterium]|nr:pyridoxamine 5'-phosphate oxidase family protein [Actinomycetota bacterium]
MAEPTRRDRPKMPDGYGVPETDDGLLDWAEVEARLVHAGEYWMATTRPDGRPHVVPRWGVWIDHHLYYDGAPTTVHARNASANQACALHLGDGRESSIIIEGRGGRSEPLRNDLAQLGERVAAEIGRKYAERGYSPDADPWSDDEAGGLMRFNSAKALAWFSFPTDLTRFHFG